MRVTSILLAMAMSAHGASSDPAKVAVDFLEKVRGGKLDLEPGGDTALSSQTADGKKQEIARRLKRMARDLGSDPLEVGAVKMDENFAGVMVRKVGGFDPNRLQVFPVALVKRGSDWSAAPVPASFENSGTGYAISLRKRLELLENWMLREQVVDLEKLREQSAARMRQKIQSSLSIEELRKLNAQQVAQRFLTACAKKDLPAVLGLLGGLSGTLPDDWTVRLKTADRAMAPEPDPSSPWNLITSPEVLRVVVNQEEEGDSGLFSVACLDPSSGAASSSLPRVEVVHFELSKTHEGLWQIDPSAEFLQENQDPDDVQDTDLDSDLADAFPGKWQQLHPASPQPTAAQVHQSFISAVAAPDLTPLLQLTKLDGDPAAARKTCAVAADLWWKVRDPSAARCALALAFHETDDAAVSLFQVFSASEPNKFSSKLIYYTKSDDGWVWSPEPRKETKETLDALIAPEVKHWSSEWQQALLKDSIELKELPGLAAPSKGDAQQVVEAWIKAVRAGDIRTALSLTARLKDPNGSAVVLRNVGYEIVGARRSNATTAITATYQGKQLTAVGTKKSDQSGKSTYPLYTVIQTAEGPRLLIELDLFAARGREFLNKIASDRLQKLGSAPAADDLRELHKQFQAEVLGSKS